ncbi:hypothetical protein OBBRIDRAFT_361349 [Obba rivulosa]|uniref:NUC153 domain-containing protein n=1 Tax=Obba rivulosa TaxID=1052685 RepID=A0A8E2DUH6_9APHY|nr:hypothetical protein OBBRIDRAFT_361349 [Obba rivulosa]
MSDPRFARFKSDPRFRRIKKDEAKVVVDDRFKSIFDDGKKKKGKKSQARVDKYGRPLADTHDQENLRRFYRLEDEEADKDEPEVKAGPDYARGAVLLESSDEEDDRNRDQAVESDDSDTGGIITLGRDVSRPIPVPGDEELEIDLDEDTHAELNAQVAAYAKENPDRDDSANVQRTRRLAVVNLDWEHVRAIHLYKICSSLVSPTAPALASSSNEHAMQDRQPKGAASRQARGKVLSVRVYPSEFGKERMAREEKEGPPRELFKNKATEDEEVNERTIYETGDGEDYDEDALRKYQLERLRYYYAIVDCDSVEAASHIYSELEGTELERSANVFDLSFVPDDMTFDDEFRDEATDDLNVAYKGLDFVTDALRHSKVKLTWDEDDPERVKITRRVLSRKELEENDFKAYLASSTSGSESEGAPSQRKKGDKAASRDKLRALLLSGGNELPEGWTHGAGDNEDDDDVDMEVTFTPGLSAANPDREETTLEKYQRKMREKKKKRKEEMKEKAKAPPETPSAKDDFFAGSSDEDEEARSADDEGETVKKSKRSKGTAKETLEPVPRHISTAEELALLAASENPAAEPKHFDMKAVLKAEKGKKGKKGRKGKKGKGGEEENELQEDFAIDVKDDRFKAVHEDHTFAIDPSNPHFKNTKSMSALLEERSKRQRNASAHHEERSTAKTQESTGEKSLQSLVESVKRKSAAADRGMGKRRKI